MGEIVTAIAYINPGTGSLFWQLILVGIAGAWVTLRTCSHWLKGRFSRKNSTGPSKEPDGR